MVTLKDGAVIDETPPASIIKGKNGLFKVENEEVVDYLQNIIGRLESDVEEGAGEFFRYNDVPPIDILKKIVGFAEGKVYWGEIQSLFIG